MTESFLFCNKLSLLSTPNKFYSIPTRKFPTDSPRNATCSLFSSPKFVLLLQSTRRCGVKENYASWVVPSTRFFHVRASIEGAVQRTSWAVAMVAYQRCEIIWMSTRHSGYIGPVTVYRGIPSQGSVWECSQQMAYRDRPSWSAFSFSTRWRSPCLLWWHHR